MKKYIIINWKMQKTHNESIDWCIENYAEMKKLADHKEIELILCPSYTALEHINKIFIDTQVKIGAQDCGFKDIGPYTGDVSIISLKDVGCEYCITGHSESRLYHHETVQSVAQKTELIINYGISPILCIGETAQEHIDQRCMQVLKNQLKPVLKKIHHKKISKLLVAYEPVWAIGTGRIPDRETLIDTSNQLIEWFAIEYPQVSFVLLYGGSVDNKTISELNQIDQLQGFLLGRSGLDFQMLKNIVLSCLER